MIIVISNDDWNICRDHVISQLFLSISGPVKWLMASRIKLWMNQNELFQMDWNGAKWSLQGLTKSLGVIYRI